MRVVLDTNVLVSALIVKVGKPAQIMKYVGHFESMTSEEILQETRTTLYRRRIRQRYLITAEDIESYIGALHAASSIVQPSITVHAVESDPDDDKFLALAQETRADYIVSGDPDLVELVEFAGILILTPARFLEILTESHG